VVDGRHQVHANVAVGRLGSGATQLAPEHPGRLSDARDGASRDEARAPRGGHLAREAVGDVEAHRPLHQEVLA
jgi:hypothetical protein